MPNKVFKKLVLPGLANKFRRMGYYIVVVPELTTYFNTEISQVSNVSYEKKLVFDVEAMWFCGSSGDSVISLLLRSSRFSLEYKPTTDTVLVPYTNIQLYEGEPTLEQVMELLHDYV